MLYMARALSFGFPDVSTRYDAIPIRIYRIVQTTGNSQPGGERAGFMIELKVSILFLVRNADKLPTVSGIARQIIRLFHCIFKKPPSATSMIYSVFLFHINRFNGVLYCS